MRRRGSTHACACACACLRACGHASAAACARGLRARERASAASVRTCKVGLTCGKAGRMAMTLADILVEVEAGQNENSAGSRALSQRGWLGVIAVRQ